MNNLAIACFVSLYKMRDYAATAETLCITQQALIRNVQKLETALGFPLFMKSASGPVPTLAGRSYYEYFLQRGREMSFASRVIKDEGREPGVCIGWSEWTGCPKWVEDQIRSFRSDYPEISVRARQAPASALRELLYSGEVDVALMSQAAASGVKGQVYYDHIFNIPLYLLISRRHAGAQPEKITPEILALPHLTSFLDETDEEQVLVRCAKEYERLGAPVPEILILPNWSSVYVEVNMKNGVAFVPLNSTVRTHDCFKAIALGREIPLTILRRMKDSDNVELLASRLTSGRGDVHE